MGGRAGGRAPPHTDTDTDTDTELFFIFLHWGALPLVELTKPAKTAHAVTKASRKGSDCKQQQSSGPCVRFELGFKMVSKLLVQHCFSRAPCSTGLGFETPIARTLAYWLRISFSKFSIGDFGVLANQCDIGGALRGQGLHPHWHAHVFLHGQNERAHGQACHPLVSNASMRTVSLLCVFFFKLGPQLHGAVR